jgi:uncharacterized DUF497 family protein
MAIFEYDSNKNESNLAKHGIDLEKAKDLFQDTQRIEIPANSETEPRFMILGKIENKFWSAICTSRGNTIRFISVRRSRKKEIAIYESQIP